MKTKERSRDSVEERGEKFLNLWHDSSLKTLTPMLKEEVRFSNPVESKGKEYPEHTRNMKMKRYVYINDDESAAQELYCDNRISNTKYTLLNFLPKNLWEQFRRFMNQYFLLIACLQLWPLITPVNPATTWGPLVFIFSVSATKEAWDDYNRHVTDKMANEKPVCVVKQDVQKHIQAKDIHVGNIVWLHENDEIPCDLVVLGTSDPRGLCYVETSAIDGETDLKTRMGVIECPIPDRDIRRFDANLRLFPPFTDNGICPLTIKNTLLQACYLRNTEWACGVAVYTGNETKLGMSRGVPEPKLTAANAMIDKLTAAVFGFQILVVTILGIAGNMWKHTEAVKHWYVLFSKVGPWYELLIIPLRFELLCSIMIPISIKVSLDLVKSFYAKLIEWDHEMVDQETTTPAHAANTAISEDLGQVEYILTDKTGTLTENIMLFKRCCIAGTFYGNESGDALKDVMLHDTIANGSPDVFRFLMVMTMCNTVIPTRSKGVEILYKSQSLDEEALVQGAARLSMVLVNKNANMLEIRFNSSTLHYELLDILEFTSERKRMSVVIKDCKNGKIILLSKGADEVILPCASVGQQIRVFSEAVDKYARLGLRTLCLAWRELKEDEYQNWALLFKKANTTLVDRELQIAEVCEQIENNLEILGVAAIEDRLQDGVAETIEMLRKGGINFWMLTGDEKNTAIQIALSCKFISPEPKGRLLLISGKSRDEVCRSLERALHTMKITPAEVKDIAFAIDGLALEIAMKHNRETFMELAILSKTAICCRVTPSQKAQLVMLLKSCKYRTLAIGDGGNDVRMIQQAHIGVGISGREGFQAARAADYSIGKFRFLQRLILVHGRFSYNRTAFLSQFSFYKSLTISFSGTSLLNSVSLMAYNVLYTSIPVLVSVLDKDLSEKTVMQHPHILSYCQKGRLLNHRTFAGWFGLSIFHAIVIFVISICSYADEKGEMEEVAMVALSGCIWLQAFVIAIETNSFTILQHLGIWGNLVGFYIINVIASAIPASGMYSIMFRLYKQPSYWTTIFLIVVVGMGPILAVKHYKFMYRPDKIKILQQAERLGGRTLSSGSPSKNPSSVCEPLLLPCVDSTRVKNGI
ncbi:hypothetical protein V2J09_019205 [Rumex salicifolius]